MAVAIPVFSGTHGKSLAPSFSCPQDSCGVLLGHLLAFLCQTNQAQLPYLLFVGSVLGTWLLWCGGGLLSPVAPHPSTSGKRSPKWAQYFGCGLTRAEQRGTVTVLSLQASLLLK